MASVFQRAFNLLSKIESSFSNKFGFRPPPEHFALAYVEVPNSLDASDKKPTSYLDELLNDFILWAVPKKRVSAEKRRMRKYSHPDYPHCWWKNEIPKTNILVCNNCGGYKEAGLLCATCYGKIKAETELIQEHIQKELKLQPVEEEVVVLYQGEKEQDPEFWKGKRIVEIPKPRPTLFSKNLLQRTTQPSATSTDVKAPDDLG